MSESHLRYTVYFESRAQAAAWAAEAEATADMPLNEQSRVLGTMLGLGEDSGVSFEFAGAAQLCAELAVLGPWSLLPAEEWPPGLMARGAKLLSCEWHDGPKAQGFFSTVPNPSRASSLKPLCASWTRWKKCTSCSPKNNTARF